MSVARTRSDLNESSHLDGRERGWLRWPESGSRALHHTEAAAEVEAHVPKKLESAAWVLNRWIAAHHHTELHPDSSLDAPVMVEAIS